MEPTTKLEMLKHWFSINIIIAGFYFIFYTLAYEHLWLGYEISHRNTSYTYLTPDSGNSSVYEVVPPRSKRK